MVSVSFFEVRCSSYVRFSHCVGCYSRLVYNVVCKALSIKGALFFVSAVTFFDMFRGWS